jgi:hypothetical protein
MATSSLPISNSSGTFVGQATTTRRTIRFCLTVLILLVAFEWFARLQLANKHSFWNAVDSSNKPIDVLFIGSSRVAAAIDTETFADAVPGPRLNVVNAGTGYANAAEFHLALRNTFREHPDRLRKAVIFIEAPFGIPDSTTWSDPWSHPERPEMLPPLLRWEDVARYWRNVRGESAVIRLEKRLRFLFDYAFRFSRLVTDRLALGEHFLGFVESPIKHALKSFAPQSNQSAVRVDLSTAGGIRNDPEGVALARKRAQEYFEKALKAQQRVDWSKAFIADSVKLAQQNGARVVFFDLPVHSAQKSISETPTRQADRAAFREAIQTRDTPLVISDFSTSDDDFPDIWHLRKSRAADFSRALAAASQQFLKSN